MRILVIGNGGREHALVWKLLQSEQVSKIYVAPGNGGTATIAENVAIKATDIDGLLDFAKSSKIDLTIVGPEAPLLAGIVDRFEAEGLRIFGPRQEAAKIEGSKRFAKEIMKKYGIPTASFRSFTDAGEAKDYVHKKGAPIVIKADGLAAGKGVVVAQTIEEAEQAIVQSMEKKIFGEAGNEIVIEEFLSGQELSLMAFVDGNHIVPMMEAQDHKPVYDGDTGPNTGGMGCYSPVPQIPDSVVQESIATILEPMIEAMKKEGIDYRGVLYAGLMITETGPKVIEFNARFGDPETQVVLPRLKTDLVEIIEAVINGRLHQVPLQWLKESAVCVVMSAKGYPYSYESGKEIDGLESSMPCYVFHAGTKEKEGKILTAGGRVLGVTSLGNDLQEAREKAYRCLQIITFTGAHYRTDIGEKALQ